MLVPYVDAINIINIHAKPSGRLASSVDLLDMLLCVESLFIRVHSPMVPYEFNFLCSFNIFILRLLALMNQFSNC